MRDLNGDVGRKRHQLIEKRLGLFSAVRPLERDRRTRVNDNRHSITIRCAKNSLQFFYVLGIFELNIRVSEVQFYSVTCVGILSTALDLGNRVVLQRVQSAKRDK